MSQLEQDQERWADLSRLLDRALELPETGRERWLAGLPPGERELAPRVRELLAHRAASAPRFDTLPKLLGTTAGAAGGDEGAERAGSEVGPYRLLRLLGQGGMGAVWLAERRDELVRRPVALKLPRSDPGERGLAERMAREREILASLDHPHIARLYDAGVTPEGQPWLALEYVKGRPIDEFLRAERPSLPARLGLFLQVTRAVAHAHGRLVVHRDLKPSNILVTEEGQVRLLDFGVAKLLEAGSAGESEFTRQAGRALTPAYASPEQLQGLPLGVTSDVYALGVVLFEMLTGARPYRPTRRSAAALEEAILHGQPERLSDAAADPALRRALRGDLDTILHKALKKAPGERYSSVEALADDVERFLDGRVVLARPDRLGYRTGKFVRRHRLAVGMAALASVALLASLGEAVWQARTARLEQRRAQEVKEFLVSIFEEADPYVAGRTPTAVDLLHRAHQRIGRGQAVEAESRVELLGILGTSLVKLQDLAGARAVLAEARDVARGALGPEHPVALRARLQLLDALRLEGRAEEVRRELEGLLPALRRLGASGADDLHEGLVQAGSAARVEGREADAVALAAEDLQRSEERWGPRDWRTCVAALMLALAHIASDRPDLAVATAERAQRMTLDLAGGVPRHPRAIQGRLVLAAALARAGQYQQALELSQDAVRDVREVFGPGSTVLTYALPRLVEAQLGSGLIQEALESSQESVQLAARKAIPGTDVMALRLEQRARALLAAGRPAEALPDLAEVVATYQRLRGPGHRTTEAARRRHAQALARAGRGNGARALEAVANGFPARSGAGEAPLDPAGRAAADR